MANTIRVSTTTNKVIITPQSDTTLNTSTSNTPITVNQSSKGTIEVKTDTGAQGPAGPPGPITPSASRLEITTDVDTSTLYLPHIGASPVNGNYFNVVSPENRIRYDQAHSLPSYDPLYTLITNDLSQLHLGTTNGTKPAGAIWLDGAQNNRKARFGANCELYIQSFEEMYFTASSITSLTDITGDLIGTASVATTSFSSSIAQGINTDNQYITTIANSTDTSQPIQRPGTPLIYRPIVTNNISGDSEKASELQIGLNNQAGSISLISNLIDGNPHYIKTLNQNLYIKVGNSGQRKLYISASNGIETTGHITGSIDNSNKIYVNQGDTSTSAQIIPYFVADGSTDGYKNLTSNISPLSYYPRNANLINGASTGTQGSADTLYIGGVANTAAAIRLESTVNYPNYILSNGGPLHITSSAGITLHNDITSSGIISGSSTGSFAHLKLDYDNLPTSDPQVKGVIYRNASNQLFISPGV